MRKNARPTVVPAICYTCLPEDTLHRVYISARVRCLPECRAKGHDVRDTSPATKGEIDAHR
jgi:hypothetical protein